MNRGYVTSEHLNPETPAGTPVRYQLPAGAPRVGIYSGHHEQFGKLSHYGIEHPETGGAIVITAAEVRHDVDAELAYLAERIPAAFDAGNTYLLTHLENARHRLQVEKCWAERPAA